MELAGVITGAIALIISVILAWKNYLSPFHIEIFCGYPRLEPLPCKLEDGSTVTRFSAILPLYFTNTGAREGVIRDIVLVVNSDQNEWLFHPFFYTKYSISTEPALGTKLIKDPSNEPFYPVYLAGKSEVHKSIVFSLLKHDRFPLGTNPLSTGKYSFTLKTLEAGKRDYETKLVFDVTLNNEQVNHLSAGNYLIPFLDEVKDKREKLHS
jgi:hypothetical protein